MPQQPKGFTWTQTTSTLKTKNIYQSLIQTVTPNLGPVYLKIDTEREFQHTNDLGWNWHKSWNIPNISVKLSLQNDQCTQWMNCQVQLMAVKLLQPDLFEEVGLEGTTIRELIDGKAFFTGVKFNSTTYNHQGHRFQLILVIKENENIILTLLSPPIFVDSRKSARDEHRQIQYISLFDPKYLERSFCKKEKYQNDIVDAPIDNNENGLHNYLTAPNIRNKIKHPFFLALKFSRCFSIYYSGNSQVENHLIEFQKQLMSKSQIQSYSLVFQSNNNRIKRKIQDSLIQLFGQNKIQVIEKKHLNEVTHKKIEFNQDDYKQVYNQLNLLMKSLNGEQQNQQSDFKQEQQEAIEIEGQSQVKQSFNHMERKSAFRKYKDFDKLPTKTFEDEKQEKLNNKLEIENYDKIQKIVKIEENNNNNNNNQLLNQQQQIVQNTQGNQINQLNSNFSILFQQKIQEQIIQFYLIQQQFLLNQMKSSM